MFIEEVDHERCIGCGKCIDVCGPAVFQWVSADLESNVSKEGTKQSTKQVMRDPEYTGCIACGHCVAICPTNAIHYTQADPPMDHPLIVNPTEVSYDSMVGLLRARRSIRKYKPTPLPQGEIEAILEAMRYAPSASNQQAWEYVILTDGDEIKRLSTAVIRIMRMALKLLNNKVVQKLFLFGQMREAVKDPGYLRSGNRIITRAEQGEDPIFFQSPCVILLHSPKYGNLGGNDAGIAFTYGMLAAQARGLGTCWVGFAQELLQRFRKYRRQYHIPRNHQVWGVMTLGYPAVKYLRAPPRHPLKVRWNPFQ